MSISTGLRVASLVCFILAVLLPVVGGSVSVNLVALGLAFWVGSTLP